MDQGSRDNGECTGDDLPPPKPPRTGSTSPGDFLSQKGEQHFEDFIEGTEEVYEEEEEEEEVEGVEGVGPEAEWVEGEEWVEQVEEAEPLSQVSSGASGELEKGCGDPLPKIQFYVQDVLMNIM